MLGFILYLIVMGLIAGFIARAVVPGRDSMSVGATMLLGIVTPSSAASSGTY